MKAQQQYIQFGFTLLELLIVIGIIGILSAIGVTRYQQHIVAAHRQAAVVGLQLAQQSMERAYLRNSTYVNALTEDQIAGIASMMPSSHEFALDSASVDTYILSVKPLAAYPDQWCGVLTIDQSGRKTISGGGTIGECWGL